MDCVCHGETWRLALDAPGLLVDEAMELLHAGVDCSVIVLWLGHKSVETTQTYLHAHRALKETASRKLKPYDGEPVGRFRPNDQPLTFLNAR
jgi:integrase